MTRVSLTSERRAMAGPGRGLPPRVCRRPGGFQETQQSPRGITVRARNAVAVVTGKQLLVISGYISSRFSAVVALALLFE